MVMIMSEEKWKNAYESSKAASPLCAITSQAVLSKKKEREIIKKRRFFVVSISAIAAIAISGVSVPLLLLGMKSYASETISFGQPKNVLPTFSQQEQNLIKEETLDLLHEHLLPGEAYSPCGHYLNSSLKRVFVNPSAFGPEYKSIVDRLSIDIPRFKIELKSAIASTSGFNSDLVHELAGYHISTFSGNADELQNSLSRFYSVPVPISNPGTYFLNNFVYEDFFAIPQNTVQNFEFHGMDKTQTVTAVSMENMASYSIKEDCQIAEFSINQTSLRIVLPNQGSSPSSIDPSLLYSPLEKQGRISFKIPEFSVSSTAAFPSESGEFMQQSNMFRFDRYGTKASSFTVRGPTASDPSFDLEFCVDRPFLFCSFLAGIPMMVGRIDSI